MTIVSWQPFTQLDLVSNDRIVGVKSYTLTHLSVLNTLGYFHLPTIKLRWRIIHSKQRHDIIVGVKSYTLTHLSVP